MTRFKLAAFAALVAGLALSATSFAGAQEARIRQAPDSYAGHPGLNAAYERTNSIARLLGQVMRTIGRGCFSPEEIELMNAKVAGLKRDLTTAIAVEAGLTPAVQQLGDAAIAAQGSSSAASAQSAYLSAYNVAIGRIRRRLGLNPEPPTPQPTPCPPPSASAPPAGPTGATPRPPEPPPTQPPPSTTPTPPPVSTPPPPVKGPKMMCPHCGLDLPRPAATVACPHCGESVSPPARAPTLAELQAATDAAGAKVEAALKALLKDCTNKKKAQAYADAVAAYDRAFAAEALADPDLRQAAFTRDAVKGKYETDKAAGASDDDMTTNGNAVTAANHAFADALDAAEKRIRARMKKLGFHFYDEDCPPPVTTPAPVPPPAATPPPPPAAGTSISPLPGATTPMPGATTPTGNTLGVRLPENKKPGKEEDDDGGGD